MKRKLFVYVIKLGVGKYSMPIIAPSDDIALDALIEISKTQPEIQNKYLYRAGEYNPTLGFIKGYRNRVIVTKKEGDNHE